MALSPGIYADRILAGDDRALDSDAMLELLSGAGDVWDLMAAAHRVCRARFGNRVKLCSIVNAKEGGCPEDCAFCSQARTAATHVRPRPPLPVDDVVTAGREAHEHGASAFAVVTATRGVGKDARTLDHMVESVRALRSTGLVDVHASLGFLSDEALDRLIEAGLTEFNHNLETGRSYFERIVSTHGYDDRVDMVRRIKAKGLRACVGGILGMGEAHSDRLELAEALRELDVDEVPLNFLVSIEGTRLENVEPLEPLDILRILACFRLFLPRQGISVAAGRMHLGQLMPLMFSAGASGMMIGPLLTTPNRKVEDDLQMLRELGLEPVAYDGALACAVGDG